MFVEQPLASAGSAKYWWWWQLYTNLLLTGASHEHNRSDRDLYVIINMDNVIPNKTKNFQMQSANYSYHNTPFDTASIMMYGENYFGIDGAVTITALKPGAIRFLLASSSRN